MDFPTRREFMKAASLGAAALPLLAAQGHSQTSSRKYRVCEIGHDGDYGHMAGAFARFPNVTMVAVADPVEKARLEHAARVKAPRSYADFREMLEEEKPDRKSTRLNSSHSQISYAVFCLKKKKMKI